MSILLITGSTCACEHNPNKSTEFNDVLYPSFPCVRMYRLSICGSVRPMIYLLSPCVRTLHLPCWVKRGLKQSVGNATVKCCTRKTYSRTHSVLLHGHGSLQGRSCKGRATYWTIRLRACSRAQSTSQLSSLQIYEFRSTI